MTHKIVQGTLSANVADAGTFTVSYPARENPEHGARVTNEGDFYLAMGHKLTIAQNDVYSFSADFDVTFNTGDITITNRTGATWLSGSAFVLELQEKGPKVFYDQQEKTRMARMSHGVLAFIALGSPDVADPDGVCASQAAAGAGNLTINGALAVGGEVLLDVARGVSIDTDNAGNTTQVVTVTGEDEYGNAMVENITCNGVTQVDGKKAFAKITQVAVDAAITGNIFVGTTDVLGLPVFLPAAGFIVKELEDGALATAGTTVAGIRTAGGSTATTGDVRGTYNPNSAADGALVFELVVALPDPGYRGIAQYAG